MPFLPTATRWSFFNIKNCCSFVLWWLCTAPHPSRCFCRPKTWLVLQSSQFLCIGITLSILPNTWRSQNRLLGLNRRLKTFLAHMLPTFSWGWLDPACPVPTPPSCARKSSRWGQAHAHLTTEHRGGWCPALLQLHHSPCGAKAQIYSTLQHRLNYPIPLHYIPNRKTICNLDLCQVLYQLQM